MNRPYRYNVTYFHKDGWGQAGYRSLKAKLNIVDLNRMTKEIEKGCNIKQVSIISYQKA